MRIHHLALRTVDLEALERFYRTILEFEVVRRQADFSVWLKAGAAVLMLERSEPDEPGIALATLELVAFAATSPQITELEARLNAAAISIEDRTQHTVYFRDPDGRRVGVSSYPLD